jgi:hypothetical protein
MGENLCLSIRENQRKFVRKPLAIVQDLRAVFLLFFPVIGELHRPPVRDVAIFSFAEYPVEHSGGTEQADVSSVQWRKRPSADVSLSGKKDSARLAIGCRFEEEIFDFVQGNAGMRQFEWPGCGNLVTKFSAISKWLKVGLERQPFEPSHSLE